MPGWSSEGSGSDELISARVTGGLSSRGTSQTVTTDETPSSWRSSSAMRRSGCSDSADNSGARGCQVISRNSSELYSALIWR